MWVINKLWWQKENDCPKPMYIPAEVTDLKIALWVQKGQEDTSRVGREGLRDGYDQNTLYKCIQLSKNKLWKELLKLHFSLLNELFSKSQYSTLPWISTVIAGSKSWVAWFGGLLISLYYIVRAARAGLKVLSFLWYKTSISIDSPNPYNCFSPVQKGCRFKILFF